MALTFVASPRIGQEQFRDILMRNGSPAAGLADTLFGVPMGYALDPAIALAFFAHESTYGKFGVAAKSLNWGNLRRGSRAYKTVGGFAYYRNWRESLTDWSEHILNRYVQRGFTTVEAAIPIYAPSSDGNAPARYIAFVNAAVAGWQAAELVGRGAGVVARVVAVDVANVRSAPALEKNVVAQKKRGETVEGAFVTGAVVLGSADWLQLRGGQFMHSSVLK